MQISDITETFINQAIQDFKGGNTEENPFEELISYGELVDRLSVVNFKLYVLKDEVMNSEDSAFRAWASVEDVRLVKERARLKKCIDEKIIAMISKIVSGDSDGGFNPEVKKYGNYSEVK